jgi:rhodanese-related sulfurtransferase
LIRLCNSLYEDVPSVHVRSVRENPEQWCLVDVRPAGERAYASLPGAIAVQAYEANPDICAGKPLLAYCIAGCKSGAYVRRLRAQEIEAAHMPGGILAWALADGPFVDGEGRAVEVTVHALLHRLNPLGGRA